MRKPDVVRLKCRHFNGVQNKVCRAGVVYRSLGKANQYPCLADEPGNVVCPSCDRYSLEEHEEEQQKIRQSVQEGIELVVSIQGMKGHAGTATCPRCGNTVRWNRADCNGHIHAHCLTTGCIAIMQ